MSEEFPGYKGDALSCLKKAGAEIGDIIRITKNDETYEGILIPRSEYGDEKHIIIKMKSGYNLGIRVDHIARIEKTGSGVRPTFTPKPLPKHQRSLPRVAIISTGGTIASRVDYRTGGVRPALSASDIYSIVPELSEIAIVDTKILLSLYSENIIASHWSKIARTVFDHINKGSAGVIVAHGTDTLGYTAAALSFALKDLPVPVILVASQRSADRPSSDAATNLIGAVTAAANAPFAEVVVAMHETISDSPIIFHRGTKVRKCHTSRRDAFRSINADPVARFEDERITMLTRTYRERNSSRKPHLRADFNDKVTLVKFHPNQDPHVLEWYIDRGFRGLVLEGTGLGHIGNYFFSSIRKAVENDVIVAMTSQCIWGRLGMNVYNQGRDLLAMGVLPLGDMLPETALVKLMWTLGQTADIDEAKILMTRNIANEVSSRTLYE